MRLFGPRIERHLIADQGEVVVDEVTKHWTAHFWPTLELAGGLVVIVLSAYMPDNAEWLPAVVGLVIVVHAVWRMFELALDRFVITNMRVFRVHGILSQRIATMPLARILDISVHKPLIGRMFGYGHFVFESAAQEQGLREIRFVGDPDGRGLTIQRVIQQAGLRGYVAGQQPMPREAPAPAAPSAAEPSPTVDIPPRPPLPANGVVHTGWDWLADAHRREEEYLDERRRARSAGPQEPFDPDRASTAPIDLPR